MTTPVRGALVVLEGLDRSGKTTQVKLLEERLKGLGKEVELFRFPDRSTPIGQMIDNYLKKQADMDDHVIHLLFAANRWESADKIKALLDKGTTVVCDRYYYSGMVYSVAKRNPELSFAWARAPEVGLPRPDVVIFLDVDEEEAKKRGGWGEEVYEKVEMQRRVKDLFWGLSFGRVNAAGTAAAAGGGLVFRQEEEDLSVVDASSGIDDVAKSIWKVVGPRVEAVERGEAGRSVRQVC